MKMNAFSRWSDEELKTVARTPLSSLLTGAEVRAVARAKSELQRREARKNRSKEGKRD